MSYWRRTTDLLFQGSMSHFRIILGALLLSACAHTPVPPQTAAGPDFLQRNAAARGVHSIPGGVQYFVLASGPKSGTMPTAADEVTLDYEGKLVTGETFDSSFERGQPLTGRAGRFVPGFTAAITRMKPGDDWLVWIPPDQAYGDRSLPGIPPNSVLRFRIILRSVQPAM